MDHKDLCEHTKIRLIAAAVGHQQCTKTAANITPIPGGDRVIAIGTPAQVRALLADDVSAAPAAKAADVHGYISKDDWDTFASGAARGLVVWLWQEPREDRVAVFAASRRPAAFANDGREPDWDAYAAAEQVYAQAPNPVDSEGGHHD